MKHLSLVLAASLVTSLVGFSGCASDHTRVEIHESSNAPAGVARIGHIVLVSLADPADTGALIESSYDELAGIPGITVFSVGTHLETGRATVDKDYDVALYIGFDTEGDYAAYVTHPKHVAYVEKWKPRMTALRIFDVLEANADDGEK